MNPDYYLGQAELASELQGFIENLRIDSGMSDNLVIDVLNAFLESKEKVTKELYLEYLPESVRTNLLTPVS